MDGLIIIHNLQVTAANAIAGLTWGFPAITQFLGYVHALQRGLPDHIDIAFDGCGVICHDHQVQAYKASEYSDAVFALTRNPVDKAGKSASFVEEGRLNMRISLAISVIDNSGLGTSEITELCDYLSQQCQTLRLAGGIVTNQPKVRFFNEDVISKYSPQILRFLLPGFALVSAQAVLVEQQQRYRQQGMDEADLKAWLSFAGMRWDAVANNNDTKESNTTKGASAEAKPAGADWVLEPKPVKAWLKPIAVGYRPLGKVHAPGVIAKVRDPNVPGCFVENLYSIGRWISPHRLQQLDQLIWRQHHTDAGDYLCTNTFESELA